MIVSWQLLSLAIERRNWTAVLDGHRECWRAAYARERPNREDKAMQRAAGGLIEEHGVRERELSV